MITLHNLFRPSEVSKYHLILKELQLSSVANGSLFSLVPFASRIPEKFYCKRAFNELFHFLSNNDVLPHFNKHSNDLNLGLKSIYEVNQLNFHDRPFDENEIEWPIFLDRIFFPALLKLIEAGLPNLSIIPSAFIRAQSSNPNGKFDTFEKMDFLKNSDFHFLFELYSNKIRNSIAHITYKFSESSVTFFDTNFRVELNKWDLVKWFDRLVDTCNGLAMAILLFLSQRIGQMKESRTSIPQEFLISELREHCRLNRMTVESIFKTKTIQRQRQLLIKANTSFDDDFSLYTSLFYIGSIAANYNAPR